METKEDVLCCVVELRRVSDKVSTYNGSLRHIAYCYGGVDVHWSLIPLVTAYFGAGLHGRQSISSAELRRRFGPESLSLFQHRHLPVLHPSPQHSSHFAVTITNHPTTPNLLHMRLLAITRETAAKAW